MESNYLRDSFRRSSVSIKQAEVKCDRVSELKAESLALKDRVTTLHTVLLPQLKDILPKGLLD